MQQHTSFTRGRSTKICTMLQLPSRSERCNEKSTWDTRLLANFLSSILPMIISLSFAHHMILILASWLFCHGENHLDPELSENPGAICVSAHSVNKRNKLRTALMLRALKSCSEKPRVSVSRETKRNKHRSYPENVDNPMIAPLYNEVRQSGPVLELQNKDLWTLPTDLSWPLSYSCDSS